MTDTYIKPLLNFLAMLAVFNLSSCGIENYIYLAPVTSISRTIDTISVTLPNGDQPDVFFSGYSIYYKIYKSSLNLTTVISTADFSSINKTMASDYAKIAPYLSDALSAINMDAFFTSISYGLTFFKLQTQTESENIENLLNGSNSSFAIKTDDTSGLVIEISSTKYTLVRSVSNSQTPNKFIYSDNLSGDDVIVSEEEGPPTTAYVLFFIVAYGVDEYGSPIFSRPAMLGVLQLPQNNYL